MDRGLAGKSTLVVAASKGLKRAAALGLAPEGARGAMLARGEAARAAAAADIQKRTGAQVLAIPGDVSRTEDISRAVSRTVAAFGGGNILVADVDGPPPGPFDPPSVAPWPEACEPAHLSPVRLIREALPHMKQSVV